MSIGEEFQLLTFATRQINQLLPLTAPLREAYHDLMANLNEFEAVYNLHQSSLTETEANPRAGLLMEAGRLE